MSEKTVKIEIELDLDKKLELDVISKAFNLSPRDFIKLAIEKDIHFIKSALDLNYPKLNLETYYNLEINIKQLRKLILVEVVL